MADLPFTYDDESKVDESIECPICYCPLIDPVEHSSYQSQCVHMFCRMCVTKQDKCPFCRTVVDKWESVALTPSTQRFIFGPLAELKVTCSKCTVSTTRKEIVKHVESCGIKLPSGFVPVAQKDNGQQPGIIQQIGSTTRNLIQSIRGSGSGGNNSNTNSIGNVNNVTNNNGNNQTNNTSNNNNTNIVNNNQPQVASAPSIVQAPNNNIVVPTQSIVPTTVVPVTSLYSNQHQMGPLYSPSSPYTPYGYANSRTYNTYYGGEGSALGGVGYSAAYPPPPSSIYITTPTQVYPPPPKYSAYQPPIYTSSVYSTPTTSSVFVPPTLPSHLSFTTSLSLDPSASMMGPEPPKAFNPKRVEYSDQFINGVELKDRRYVGGLFSGTEMKNVILSGTHFIECRFEQCKFDTCDFQRTVFMDCVFDSCTFTLCNFSNSQHQSTYFYLSTASETNMFSIKSKAIKFGSCTLNTINFAQSSLEGAQFQSSYLTDCIFSSCQMNQSDLSSSKQINCQFKDVNYNPPLLY